MLEPGRLTLAICGFRVPHEQNEEPGLTWETLTETTGEIV
jgi:hypothetical protein